MKNRSFKTAALAALALLGMAFAVVPTTAKAGGGYDSRYSHRCDSCDSRIYEHRVIVGYTRCGDPIYRWVTDSHRCHHDRYSDYGRYDQCDRIYPHDIIAGIVTGIIEAHHDHRREAFGHHHHCD
ncbi:MAG: hypothetical protein KDN19_08510 [Verrucomicrobiae bacterium]|nr:hypothetical protein [Verrucomicrobiae bacterium]